MSGGLIIGIEFLFCLGGLKIFFSDNDLPPHRASMLQLLSRYFISIFHTKFRYLAQKNK